MESESGFGVRSFCNAHQLLTPGKSAIFIVAEEEFRAMFLFFQSERTTELL
jgi:hypothetical protein